ncbi:alpha/beta-hydrolase [Daedalea quercina L-15889]|uniref:Alpha/beta-hydrolase n=1 Tax=Daedalea quercina L-15889 TaxID=1314783 RepID=A0A165LUY2_9APHY|nr:alpha/beta-hydrolase [Daedalea quercina L-15889]
MHIPLLTSPLWKLVFAILAVASPSVALESRAANVSTPAVDLGYAQYQGAYDSTTNVSYFFGIRYAQAPTGDLRWRAPQTPTTSSGVQQATAQPHECYQSPIGNSSTNPYRTSPPQGSNSSTTSLGTPALEKRAVTQDEDCLFLNLYAPGELQSNASLPVVVFIHGGGYLNGAASTYSGQDIIKESGFGVVTVIIQYRLGVFGFLPGSEVQANGSQNVGLLDQNFALQWVQEHIASFGGDPTKVTIWGESAGAGSVIQHIIANGGQTTPPLFRAAITSSTYLPYQYYYNDSIPEAIFSETVSQTSCSSASDKLACLRSADASLLQTVNNNINLAGFFGASVYVPVVDGTFIVERPTVTIEKQRLNGEMLLAVTNSYEGYNFVDVASPPANLTGFVTELFPLINESTVQTIVQEYENDTALTSTTARAVAVLGESIFICPTYLLLQAFGDNAYKGEFAIPPAHHAQDLQYYFPTAFPPVYNNSELITSFSQSFMSVIRSLNPNDKFLPDLKPAWSVWQNGTAEMLFNVTAAGEPAIDTTTTDPALLERCATGNASAPGVDLGYAQYQGTYDSATNTSYFFGIRYAQAPTGTRQPSLARTADTDHNHRSPTGECYQSSNGNSSTNPYRTSSPSNSSADAHSTLILRKRAVTQDEDCLFLSIYTPGDLQPYASLPVLVWIHGRGYIAGAECEFTGQDIIKESNYSIVTVLIQYRLGVFDFLPGSEVQADGALNAGLLDQNFALQWIASFGGDPTKVTTWGESAGAGSVIQHIVAHGRQTEPPLFRAGMTSSTFLPFQYYYNDTVPEAMFSETVAQTNCSSASDALASLRSADASLVQTANTNINVAGFFGTFVFVPVIDESFIVERPTATLEKRRVNDEMLLAVTNSNEGYVFVDVAAPPTNLTDYVTELFPWIDEATVQTIVYEYTEDNALVDTLSQAIAVMGESIFICPTYLLLQAFGDNAYEGEFAIPPAYHSQDVQYYFPTADPPVYNNSELITSFSQSFMSVVRSLNPNDKILPDLKPAWSIWQNGTTEMLFSVTTAGEPVIRTTTTNPALLERCA